MKFKFKSETVGKAHFTCQNGLSRKQACNGLLHRK